MKKMVLVLTLAAFALSGSAFAQDPNYFDNIGLYLTPEGHLDPTALDGTGSCGQVTPLVAFPAYLVLSQMTMPEVWGWEVKITPSNLTVLEMNVLGGDHVDAGTKVNEYIIGLVDPIIAVGGAVVLADLLLLLDGDPAQPGLLFLDGVYFSSLVSGLPAYLNAPGGENVAMHNIFGDPFNPDDDIPQLITNGDCMVVGVEEDSWGSVKSMFR